MKVSIVKDHVSGEKLITSVSVGHRLKPRTQFSKGKIAKIKNGKLHFASKINGHQPPDLTKENIEFTINAKVEKLPIYKQKMLNQIWLLITTDLNLSPVSFNLTNKIGNWNFFSGFQKVFLFELETRIVFELNVQINW